SPTALVAGFVHNVASTDREEFFNLSYVDLHFHHTHPDEVAFAINQHLRNGVGLFAIMRAPTHSMLPIDFMATARACAFHVE
ncbi:hypothetical protein B0H11DRAFT_1708760, partial [Mycena galericulata]